MMVIFGNRQILYTAVFRAIIRAIFVTFPGFMAVLLTVTLSMGMAAYASAAGLGTRDQNPLLQRFYLPTLNPSENSGWQSSHLFLATNTYQRDASPSEFLEMDVEMYRYDLSIGYQWDQWRLTATTALISYQSGALDEVIDSFHQFFNLPEGGRPNNPNDRINLDYRKNGLVVFSQDFRDSGLGDLAISLSKKIWATDTAATEISVGVELPAGELSVYGDNSGVDTAFWITHNWIINPTMSVFGLLGRSYLETGGIFNDQIKDYVKFLQFGCEYRITEQVSAVVQFDFHSPIIKDSTLNALGKSAQIQTGFKVSDWVEGYDVDLFVSEDIKIGSAPDVSFGLGFTKRY